MGLFGGGFHIPIPSPFGGGGGGGIGGIGGGGVLGPPGFPMPSPLTGGLPIPPQLGGIIPKLIAAPLQGLPGIGSPIGGGTPGGGSSGSPFGGMNSIVDLMSKLYSSQGAYGQGGQLTLGTRLLG